MRAARHRNAALRRGWPATHCEGFIRRLFVRPGGGKYYVPVGWLCDECGALQLDPERQEQIEAAKAKAPWRKEAA